MFGLTGLQVRLGAIALLVLVIGVFAYSYNQRGEKIVDLRVEKGVQEAQVVDLVNTVGRTTSSTAITEEMFTLVMKESVEISRKQDKIKNDVEKKVSKVKKAYAAKPQTPEVQKKQDNEINTIRVNGLWDSYCIAVPREQATDMIKSACQCRWDPTNSACQKPV